MPCPGREWHRGEPLHFFELIESEAGRYQIPQLQKEYSPVRSGNHIHSDIAEPKIVTDCVENSSWQQPHPSNLSGCPGSDCLSIRLFPTAR